MDIAARTRRLSELKSRLPTHRLELLPMLRFVSHCAFIALLFCSPSLVSAASTGVEIYRNLCASCHGANGEGTSNHAVPLLGDKSVGELAELIERTMPEGEPEKCIGDDAKKVAAYIHETFYGPAAQARNAPARVELSRLTVRQYGETMADLIGSFRTAPKPLEVKKGELVQIEPGLFAEYMSGAALTSKNRFLTRIDPGVQFDFKDQAPPGYDFAAAQEAMAKRIEEAKAKKLPKNQIPAPLTSPEFSARWQGVVIPPETGDYEFTIRTENGSRVWVNDLKKPLIDGSVRSGKVSEYSESIRLLAGRAYPIRVEMSKSQRGKETTASIVLFWQPPHRAREPIPGLRFSTATAAEQYVVHTKFPPDDKSTGYERGTDVSKAWEQATTEGAIEAAAYVTARLPEFTGAGPTDKNRGEKMQRFCTAFAERAFRRPLTKEQQDLYVDRQFREAKTPEQALQRSMLLTLKSPRFLYRDLAPAARDPYSVASRLSYALWDSAPDAALLQAAAEGKLQSPTEVRAQAERMAADPRTRAKLAAFVQQWLNVEHFGDLSKDPQLFPKFDPQLVADLRTSLDLFLDDVLASPAADLRRLLTSDETYLNPRLAEFYGEKSLKGDGFHKVKWEADRRAGLLTHPLVLAGLAYTDVSSPIHRGVLISRSMLGRALRPPPEAVQPLPVTLHPNLTTRERVTLQTKSETCAACHTMINRLGFALEGFDAVGRSRSTEKDKPIDAEGAYRTQDDKTVKFTGGRELAKFLAASPETHAAVVQQLFQHETKQPILAYGLNIPAQLTKSFLESEYNLRKLAVEIAVTAATVEPTVTLTAAAKGP